VTNQFSAQLTKGKHGTPKNHREKNAIEPAATLRGGAGKQAKPTDKENRKT